MSTLGLADALSLPENQRVLEDRWFYRLYAQSHESDERVVTGFRQAVAGWGEPACHGRPLFARAHHSTGQAGGDFRPGGD